MKIGTGMTENAHTAAYRPRYAAVAETNPTRPLISADRAVMIGASARGTSPARPRPERVGVVTGRDQAAPTPGRGYAALVRHLAEQPDEKSAMSRVATLATDALGCRGALILRETAPGQYHVSAATEPKFVLEAGSVATEHGDSISQRVLAGRGVVVVDDLPTDPEWSGYGPELAARTAVRSILGFLLHVDGRSLGSMTLYSDEAGHFTRELQDEAVVFGDLAAIALARVADRERAANLDTALVSSRDIGTAVGIIMATDGVAETAAFRTLRGIARSSQRKVREVAREISALGYRPPS